MSRNLTQVKNVKYLERKKRTHFTYFADFYFRIVVVFTLVYEYSPAGGGTAMLHVFYNTMIRIRKTILMLMYDEDDTTFAALIASFC